MSNQNVYVISAMWFDFYDEPVSGRGNGETPDSSGSLVIGEDSAFGLLDVTDTPKYDLVSKVRAANVAAITSLGLLGKGDTLTLDVAKQKASGKLVVYVTSTDPTAVLTITAIPVTAGQPPIDLGMMAQTSPNGNEFFRVRNALPPIGSVQTSSTGGGSLTATVKGN